MRFAKKLIALVVIALISSASVVNADISKPRGELGTMDGAVTTHERPPLVEKYLLSGSLREGEIAVRDHLRTHKNDDQARFGLGVLLFIKGIQGLCQDLYRYGLMSSSKTREVPFLRLPIPQNPHPEKIAYKDARAIAERLVGTLMDADATLAEIKDANVKLPLHFGLIKVDLNGDGVAYEQETLWKIYAHINRTGEVITEEKSKQFYIKFDRGDVHWLRGYCHLLSSMCNIYLAYDSHETFETTAHVFFPLVDSPYKFLATGRHVHDWHNSDVDILDFIAFIHTIRWPVVEPQRMEAALRDWQTVVAQSKESWKWIMAETDDDHEWIPNPKQTGVIPNAKVTEQMVTTWLSMMDEIDKLLAGETLVPFWRGDGTQGVNIRKIFTNPTTLDLVLWVQGPAAAPYLESGTMTKTDVWRSLRDAFGGNFPGFAVWFN